MTTSSTSSTHPHSTSNDVPIADNRFYDYKVCLYPMLHAPSSFRDLEFVLSNKLMMTVIYLESTPAALHAAQYLDSIAPPNLKDKIISFKHLELYPDIDETAEQITIVCVHFHPPLSVADLLYVDRSVQFGVPADIFTFMTRSGCRVKSLDMTLEEATEERKMEEEAKMRKIKSARYRYRS
ncbi:hypothetical protein FBU30_009517 [Linnemannia zychae]|nr:hypothetical protein FBU30_009517 [Linnemannia zychae]